jgi:hypothetical protein
MLGFFSQLQNYMPHPREPKFEKVGLCGFLSNSLIIVHKAAFVSLKSSDSDEDV